MLAALYARVSTQRQEKEETIETQIMAIRDFAARNGHNIVEEYRDDGWSGTLLARPELDRLRMDAGRGKWDAVIVYDPDRLARKLEYILTIIRELEEKDVSILFVTIPASRSGLDNLMYTLKGLVAEIERTNTAERFRLGKLHKARSGHVVTSSAPYGYNYVPKIGNIDGYYEINEYESKNVKLMFHWIWDENLTVRKVIKRLYEKGIKPRKSKTGKWCTSTLSKLFHCETYIGMATFCRTRGTVPKNPRNNETYKRIKKSSRVVRDRSEWVQIPVPAIIEADLFYHVQERLQKNYDLHPRNRKNEYLLAGLIECTCGKSRAGEGPGHGKNLYYRCTDRISRYPLPNKCHVGGLNARVADKYVWERLVGLFTSPKHLKAHIQRWIETKHQVLPSSIPVPRKELDTQLGKLNREEQNYLKLFGSDLVTMDRLNEMLAELKRKRLPLEKQLRQIDSTVKPEDDILPSSEGITKFSREVKGYLKSCTFQKKREIIERCVEKVIATQKSVRVIGYLPITKESKKEHKYVNFRSIYRNCWVAECREVDAV